jgi:hypothetical protein
VARIAQRLGSQRRKGQILKTENVKRQRNKISICHFTFSLFDSDRASFGGNVYVHRHPHSVGATEKAVAPTS